MEIAAPTDVSKEKLPSSPDLACSVALSTPPNCLVGFSINRTPLIGLYDESTTNPLSVNDAIPSP